MKFSHCFINVANINNTENIINNTGNATQKKLRQIMYYNWCFRHFAAANLSMISSKLIDFVKLFSMATIQKSQK